MSGQQGWVLDVLDFWFGLDPSHWFRGPADLDERIRERFEELWADKRSLPPKSFLGSAEEALAAVILFDQLPRNMFRGHADQFSTDPLALAVAKGTIDRGLDRQLTAQQRGFLYMPFQHSEDIDDQRRALLLFAELGDAEQMRYARLHHDVIERFGRFPHRNAILDRSPRADELAAGDVVPW